MPDNSVGSLAAKKRDAKSALNINREWAENAFVLNNPYREILAAPSNAQVDFIIGGGVACVLQGVERVTMDIEFLRRHVT